MLQANLPSSVQAKAGDFVYRADVVQTGADGKVNITFTDGTAFNLSSNARMEVNEFVFSPDGQSNSSFFKLAKGTFTFVAGKVAKSGNMKIDTALATVGIRGTTPHVEVLEDGRVKFSTLIEDKDGVPNDKSRRGASPHHRTSPSCEAGCSGARPDDSGAGEFVRQAFQCSTQIVSGLLSARPGVGEAWARCRASC